MWLYFYNKSLLVQTKANFVPRDTQSQFPAESVYRLCSFLCLFYFPAIHFFLHTLGSSPLL
jgi:hypothetical protein